MLLPESSPILKIVDNFLVRKKISIWLKRDDKIHDLVSGNKFRKLKYNITSAKKNKKTTLLTFGGAYSNHIYAVAAAGNLTNFKTIGLIRGEKTSSLNPTLLFAKKQGMELIYISRADYKKKTDPNFLAELEKTYDAPYILPEGGTNTLAVKGCSEIVGEIDIPFDYICSAVGTGGTLAGLIAGCNDTQKVIGFSALKGGDFLNKEVANLLYEYNGRTYQNWQIQTDYHFGGYAKIKPELIAFINRFWQQHGIKLEPIYTGKMLFGIYDLIEKGFFKQGTNIVAVHTGGLQGLEGFKGKGLVF